MQFKDVRSLDDVALIVYIAMLGAMLDRLQHTDPCEDLDGQLKDVEEEICWANHELEMRSHRVGTA